MGEDPKTSVVDIYGKSHECDRPYVIGGGQFPTYMGYNPTGTIHAMAYMTAEQLVK
jgi:gluconate 2-dehydrogenase alpha chain